MPRKRDKWKSELEDKFLKEWRLTHPRVPIVTQHIFHPDRKWRFDFAFPAIYLAIEIQGYGTGHASYLGMASDYEKHNEAIRYGWSLLYLMAHDLEPKTIPKTIKYVHETIVLRSSSASLIKQISDNLTPQPVSPKQLFERMKNAKSYRRRKR